jgi:hypothetical protein
VNGNFRSQFSEEMEEVVGEAVVVIDQYVHLGRRSLVGIPVAIKVGSTGASWQALSANRKIATVRTIICP